MLTISLRHVVMNNLLQALHNLANEETLRSLDICCGIGVLAPVVVPF